MTTIKHFTVDDNFDVIGCTTLKEANKKATEMKKANSLREVFISKVVEGSNGEETEVIAKL